MNNDFTFTLQPREPKLRPCTVDGNNALFHRWEEYAVVIEPSPMVGGHRGGQLCQTYAIVEMEDGQVKEVKPSKIRFRDTKERFALLTEMEAPK